MVLLIAILACNTADRPTDGPWRVNTIGSRWTPDQERDAILAIGRWEREFQILFGVRPPARWKYMIHHPRVKFITGYRNNNELSFVHYDRETMVLIAGDYVEIPNCLSAMAMLYDQHTFDVWRQNPQWRVLIPVENAIASSIRRSRGGPP